jgi:hypothetical protein
VSLVRVISLLQAAAYNPEPMKAAIAILISACCVLAVAACGGSNSEGASAASNPQLKLSECLRAHGVPAYPDPVFPAGGGIERPSVPGLNINSPSFQRAAKLCNRR